jgi:hypothetical protein
LWTLCDDAAPWKGFCMSLAQVKEIRLRYTEDRARLRLSLVDASEKLAKANVRLEAAAAQRGKEALVATFIALGVLAVGVAVGIPIGILAF